MNINLQQFRASLDDTYTNVLASDSRTGARLTVHIQISDECGTIGTFFRLRSPLVKAESQNIAELSRLYWEVVSAG